jgi:hypothetical protein
MQQLETAAHSHATAIGQATSPNHAIIQPCTSPGPLFFFAFLDTNFITLLGDFRSSGKKSLRVIL